MERAAGAPTGQNPHQAAPLYVPSFSHAYRDTCTQTHTHMHALSTLLHGLEELLQLQGKVQVTLHLQPPAHVGTQGTQVTHQEVLQVFLCHLQDDVGAALGYSTASPPAACRT